jgi:phosphoribosyl 1,2-cyclic phosphodiesterase
MPLAITSLNSGSNGNCYYIGNEQEAVLVDVGISCRETELRMRRLGLSMRKVKAIFVSHEHSDHIKRYTGAGPQVQSCRFTSHPIPCTARASIWSGVEVLVIYRV